MKKVQFGNYNSFDDFSLILSSIKIESPAPKTKTIDVEGGDGVLDLSELFGRLSYKNRKIQMQFTVYNVSYAQLTDLYTDIQNKIQGQKLNITISDDPDYYYVGRLTISAFTTTQNVGKINIDCDCEPYKYKKGITIVSQAVSGTATVNLKNLKKRVVPTIKTNASMTFEYTVGGTTYRGTHSAGEFMLPTLELTEGDNLVTITGTGNVTLSYQEGGL